MLLRLKIRPFRGQSIPVLTVGGHSVSLAVSTLALGYAASLGFAAAADTPPPATPAAQNDQGTVVAAPATDLAVKAESPQMVLPDTTKTAEDVQGGSVAHFSFQVQNQGKGDLNITAVQPGCGCTVASFDPVVKPGATGTISADVHTQPLWGQVVKTLTMNSNDPTTPQVTLFLVVKAIPAYTITPEGMANVLYEDAKPISRVFTIQSHAKDGLKLTQPPKTTGPITAEVKPDATTPGTYQVTLTLTPPTTGGDTMGQVDVPTDTPGVPPIHLTLVALGQKGLSASPPLLNFGVMAAGLTSHATVGVYSRGAMFHVTKVDTDDPVLTARFSAQPTAISWFDVVATYTGGWKPGLHTGTLTIHTDSPLAPILKVPYQADVR